MEVTLEKIELVKDRTGVSYKEAKEALEAADGSVVDAIINIEENIDELGGKSIGEHGSDGFSHFVLDRSRMDLLVELIFRSGYRCFFRRRSSTFTRRWRVVVIECIEKIFFHKICQFSDLCTTT